MNIFLLRILPIVIVLSLGTKKILAQQPPTSLPQAVDNYLASTPENETTHFNNMMKLLTKDCSNDDLVKKIANKQVTEIEDSSEIFDYACINNKFFGLIDAAKINSVLDKMVSLPKGSNPKSCVTDATCPGNTSCLSMNEEDYSQLLGGKGDLLLTFKEIDEETTKNKKIGLLGNNATCEYNYQCQGLNCSKQAGSSTGICKQTNFCRLGRSLDKVKADGGACESGLDIDEMNICLNKLSDENLYTNYKRIKDDLAKKACGEFGEQVTDPVTGKITTKDLKGAVVGQFAKDLRSFELMMLLAQNLQSDLSQYKGANRYHYHQLPKRVKELFLTQYMEDKKTSIKKMNDKFAEFTKQFSNVIASDGKSTDQVNFFDINVIQQEMHSQKETASYYLTLYQEWIKSQQAFHKDAANLMNTHMVIDNSEASGFMAVLNALARTTKNSDKAPLFNGNDGKKNKKRWFLALSLPTNQSDFKYFYESPYIERAELDKSNFRAKNSVLENLNPTSSSNWYWNAAMVVPVYGQITALTNAIIVGSKSRKTQLLDPILPPNGCKLIDSTRNECGSEGDNFWRGDWFTGTNGKFEKDISSTLEKLFNAWHESIVLYYKNLAKNLPANYIIDPELNIYAGCIQQGNFSQINNPSGSSQSNVTEFYKNFCTPDLNKNGVVDEAEKITEKLMKQLAKKVLSYSLAYSYNANKRPVSGNMSNSYQDEFAADESTTLFKRPEWIDTTLKEPHIDPATKFYNFKHGTKKQFLNRIRNKYFFMTQLYDLLAENYNKQLTCINNSGGEFTDPGIVNTSLTPTPTPKYNPGTGNTNGGSNAGSTNAGGVNANSAGGNQPTSKDKNTSDNSNSALNLSSGQSGSSSSGFGNSGAQKTQNIDITTNSETDDGKKSLVLGGVNQKGATGSTGNDSNLSDKRGAVGSFSNLYGSEEGNSNGSAVGATLNQQEQEKVQATLNSNQDPQFSDDDTLFTQITKRYIKNYRTIFRSERRSSAQ